MTEIAKILPADVPPRAGVVAPNVILRSALFGAGKRVGQSVLREKLASLGGIDITFTGLLLSQADLDIWHGLLGLEPDADGWREFSARALLAQIGRDPGKGHRDRLENAIARLSANSIEIKSAGITYGGSLVDEFVKTDRGGWWRIRANPHLAALFGKNSWTGIDAAARAALAKKPLAQWLHAFYSTHRTPLPISTSKLLELSGSGASSLFHFRSSLRAALAELERVTGWGCRLTLSDLVEIVKNGAPTPAHPEEGRSPQQITPPDAPARQAFESTRASLGLAPAPADPGDQFTAFWEAYHQRKRTNFVEAAATWRAMGLDDEAEAVMEGLERWKKSQDWWQDDGRWIPTPDNFLKKRRWLDAPAPFKAFLTRCGKTLTHHHGDVPRDYGKNGPF